MSLSCTTVTWRGLTFASDLSSPFGIRRLEGWDERPASRLRGETRPGQHGAFSVAPLSDERVVTLTGQIVSQDRDALLAEMDSVLGYGDPSAPAEELVVSRAGRVLTASAHLTAFRTPTDSDWAFGVVPFGIEWRCADPLRYGPAINRTTTFATSMGGLEFDLFTDGTSADVGYLDFGAQGSTGRIVLPLQDGTAPGATQFLVEGPVPRFSIVRVESGRRISFSRPVAAGDSLLIDPATGSALLNGGDVDYSGLLTRWEWDQVLPGEPATFAFLPDGEFDTGTLTVIHRAAWW